MSIGFLLAIAAVVFLFRSGGSGRSSFTLASIAAQRGVPHLGAALAAGRQRLDPHRAVVLDRPMRVVGDLPRMAVGVDEHARVAAPERLAPARPIVAPAASASASTASTSSGARTL